MKKNLNDLIGKVFKDCYIDRDDIVFIQQNGTEYRVSVMSGSGVDVFMDEPIVGYLDDLIGRPIKAVSTQIVRLHEDQVPKSPLFATEVDVVLETEKGFVTIPYSIYSEGNYDDGIVEIECFS